jgi:hypothetical protein
MIYFINYADENFECSRRYNSKSAYSKGKVDQVIEFSPADIDRKFKNKHKNIFSYKRGAGLWLWKPYIILKALDNIENGDYLFYCDSGAIIINSIGHLIPSLTKSNQDIMLFELPLLARQFTKKETYVLMDCDKYDENQVLAGYIFVKKSNYSVKFIRNWLEYMCDERILSGKNFLKNINEFDDFVVHREDQSVLSILCRKHNLEVFRDPSDFGDRPWEYASNRWTLNKKKYSNSEYPKILIGNRSANPLVYKYKERIKTILSRAGVYNEKIFLKKNNINF